MSGEDDGDQERRQHSPRTRGIIQHFERHTRRHAEALEEDVRVTNERLALMETAQIDTNQRLAAMEGSIGAVNTSLDAILRRLERMEEVRNNEDRHHHSGGSEGSAAVENEDSYVGDTELDDDAHPRNRHPQHRNRRGRGARPPRREVRDNDDSLGNIKFTMPSFNGKYDPDAYLTWELAVDQKFVCHDFPENKRVRAATSEFTDFASI